MRYVYSSCVWYLVSYDAWCVCCMFSLLQSKLDTVCIDTNGLIGAGVSSGGILLKHSGRIRQVKEQIHNKPIFGWPTCKTLRNVAQKYL